jgi:hypothetical protein
MIQSFETAQQLGQQGLDAAVRSLAAVTQGAQAIVSETGAYANKSYESGKAGFEKLAGVKSLDKAFEIQNELVRSAYDGFVAHSTRLGELYTNLATEAWRPYEGLVGKAAPLVRKAVNVK